MTNPGVVKMTAVNSDMIESVGYVAAGRKLFVKFRNLPAVCYEGVPNFRFQGLMAAPRKDAYFRTYIKDQFLSKEAAAGGV